MAKKDILITNGTYNKNYTKVLNEKFQNDPFFDPMDIVQVKYEMLKTANGSELSVSKIADEFGFSRAAFYKIKASYETNGIAAFVPEKSSPHKARKLTDEHQSYIDRYIKEKPKASSTEIAQQLKQKMGTDISKRTIERYRRRRGHY